VTRPQTRILAGWISQDGGHPSTATVRFEVTRRRTSPRFAEAAARVPLFLSLVAELRATRRARAARALSPPGALFSFYPLFFFLFSFFFSD